MKSYSEKAMKQRLVKSIKELSPEDCERVLLLINFINIATSEQMEEMKRHLKLKDFKGNHIRQWIDSKRPLVTGVV